MKTNGQTILERNPVQGLNIPDGAHFFMEKELPYLLVHRTPKDSKTLFSIKLTRNEAAYYIVEEGNTQSQQFLKKLIGNLADTFGAFLIFEISQKPKKEESDPDFIVHGPTKKLPFHVRDLEEALTGIRIDHQTPKTITTSSRQPDLDQVELLPLDILKKYEAYHLGLTVQSSHFDEDGGIQYPSLERELIKGLAEAFHKVLFSFIKIQTNVKVSHFHELAPKQVEDIVWKVDRELWKVNQEFEFLMLISPVNHYEAWEEFKDGKFLKAPTFHYRMLPEDPEVLKKRLYQIPVEQITDPTLNYIFRDKRLELDKMLTALACRDSKDFLYTSLQIYGDVDEKLYQSALELVEKLPDNTKNVDKTDFVDSFKFSQMVEAEFDFFQEQDPEFRGQYELSQTVPGLMVSKGKLYIPHDLKLGKDRAVSLIQHEVGTHILTYYNGTKQPLHLFRSGVPGYEELQEGLAVLAEYLSGGLNIKRLRMLAARVIAIYQLLHGEDFPSVCHRLTTEFFYEPAEAFGIALRVFRGGGFTKDAVYLRGLIDVLDYISTGNKIEPLLVGKIRQDYLPVIEELQKREILQMNALIPRYLKEQQWKQKIKNIKAETSLIDLVKA